MKVGDLEPPFECFLSVRTDSGAIIPLEIEEGSALTFIMKNLNTYEIKVSAAAEVIEDSIAKIRYTWQAGDTDEAGQYAVYIVYTAEDRSRTFPGEGHHPLRIENL